MLKLTLTSLFSLISLSIFAQGINFFEGTWEEAKAEAKKTNKHIFVDAYTTWCGPCKFLKKDVFPQQNVGDVFNPNYISIAIDMEKGEGIDFAKKYNVQAFPTLLYFNPEGELVHINVGANEPEVFAQWGIDALDPSKQLFTLKHSIENADAPSKEDLLAYLTMAYNSYSPDAKLLSVWINQLSTDDFTDGKTLQLIGNAAMISTYDTKVVTLFKEHEEEVVEALNGRTAESIYGNIAMTSVRGEIDEDLTSEEWNALKKRIEEALGKEKIALTITGFEISYNMKKKNYSEAVLNIDKAIMLYEAKEDQYLSNRLNSYAWTLFEAEVEAKYMKKALTWINRSVQIEAGYANVDTQANILFVLKKYDKAKVAAEKAIALGQEKGQDTSGTEELLKKINSSMN